jgi:large subunit ribosomal protein L15
MRLNELRDNPGARQARKRLGRGESSGLGKTSGKGEKGQKARTGVSIGTYQGGQMPLERRLPKRGFNNVFRKSYAEVNLGRIQAAIDAKRLDPSGTLNAEALRAAGIIGRPRDGLRLLANGEIKTKITVEAAGASASAIAAVEKVGGSVILPPKKEEKPSKKARHNKKPQVEAKAEAEAPTEGEGKAEGRGQRRQRGGDGKPAEAKPDKG